MNKHKRLPAAAGNDDDGAWAKDPTKLFRGQSALHLTHTHTAHAVSFGAGGVRLQREGRVLSVDRSRPTAGLKNYEDPKFCKVGLNDSRILCRENYNALNR